MIFSYFGMKSILAPVLTEYLKEKNLGKTNERRVMRL